MLDKHYIQAAADKARENIKKFMKDNLLDKNDRWNYYNHIVFLKSKVNLKYTTENVYTKVGFTKTKTNSKQFKF